MNRIFNIVSRFFVVVVLYYGFFLVGSIINSFIFLFVLLYFGKPSHHFELFIPKSDKYLISLYNINPDSNIKVTRMDEMITN